ncbi:hypothetical protein NDU88_002286, partial [Pleurodeles waltl]
VTNRQRHLHRSRLWPHCQVPGKGTNNPQESLRGYPATNSPGGIKAGCITSGRGPGHLQPLERSKTVRGDDSHEEGGQAGDSSTGVVRARADSSSGKRAHS